ncbi:MAG TPA: hypothetical protein VK968_18950, partial [Roseimicrobium sp.]|nr:hypothetical protein [Roseimicrobium sp.]
TYDRALAGFPLRRKHFLEGLPEQTQRVAFHRKDESSMVMEALPGFSRRQVLDDYPGWFFLSKP